MANTSSAKKAVRNDATKRVQNLRRHRSYRDERKKVLAAIAAKDKDAAEAALSKFNKAVAKAAKKGGPLHQNTASRYMSRLAKKVATAFE